MSRRFIFVTTPIILLIGAYFLGPTPERPVWNLEKISVPSEPDALEQYVAANEARHQLKPDNEARIVWRDSSRTRTEYSIVYLHGFSASQEEGDPVHEEFAKAFGCNLYLARLEDHGVDTTEALLYFTPDRWWRSSREALAIGKALGDKVIVMSTSTGGTMALILAASYPEDVYALINMSPNIAINNSLAWISNNPWGLQLARVDQGGDYRISPVTMGADPVLENQYWNLKYRLEAVSQLQELLESQMNPETFSKVNCPTLNLYFYKNEMEQDPTVKVSAILDMHNHLSTPDSLKVAVPLPNAGGHVLGSHVVSKDIESVHKAVRQFAVEKLHLKPVGL